MSRSAEKGGGSFQGLKLLLCENPLPPLDEAIEAARIDEAFIGMAGEFVAAWVPRFSNLLVTRTLSKAQLRPIPAGCCRRPERPQRRPPAGARQPGRGAGHAAQRGTNPGTRRTTARPENNGHFVHALKGVLSNGQD
jgi:hypothetical protein